MHFKKGDVICPLTVFFYHCTVKNKYIVFEIWYVCCLYVDTYSQILMFYGKVAFVLL